eukprot:SAG11_NODE_740_length_7421_cov_6.264818_2_plen_175_part_00
MLNAARLAHALAVADPEAVAAERTLIRALRRLLEPLDAPPLEPAPRALVCAAMGAVRAVVQDAARGQEREREFERCRWGKTRALNAAKAVEQFLRELSGERRVGEGQSQWRANSGMAWKSPLLVRALVALTKPDAQPAPLHMQVQLYPVGVGMSTSTSHTPCTTQCTTYDTLYA